SSAGRGRPLSSTAPPSPSVSPAALDRAPGTGERFPAMGDSGRPTIVAGLVARLLEVAARCGVGREVMLADGHLDPSSLEERDNRMPVEAFARLWHVLAARRPEKVLALEWASSWRITDAGVMGYVLQQLATLGEAMETVARYGCLVNQAATPRVMKGT